MSNFQNKNAQLTTQTQDLFMSTTDKR